MFICLLISIIITVLYLIIVIIFEYITKNRNYNSLISKAYKTNNTKKYPNQNIQYEPIIYVPPYNIVKNP